MPESRASAPDDWAALAEHFPLARSSDDWAALFLRGGLLACAEDLVTEARSLEDKVRWI